MKDRSCPSEKTIEERESVFRLRINPFLGNRKLHDLRDQHINAFYRNVNDQAKAMGHSTALFHSHKVFNGFLNWAVRRGYIVVNPTSPNTQETVQSWIAATKSGSKQFFLTEELVEDMLEAVCDKPHAIIFHLMVRSGLRLGEALAAKWEDIDFDERCINVRRQVQEVSKKVLVGTKKESEGSQHIIDPKSRAGIRTAPLQGDTIELLCRLPQQARTGYICGTASGTPIHGSTFRGRIFKPTMELIGVPDVTPHDLRRYSGTDLLALANKFGTDLDQVRQMMGHTELSTTLDIYAKSRPDYQKRFFNLLANRHVA